MASNDGFSSFYDIHVVFGEYRDTTIVAQFSDGNKGPRLEVFKDVYKLCFLGEFLERGIVARAEGSMLAPFATCTEGPVEVGWMYVQYCRAKGTE